MTTARIVCVSANPAIDRRLRLAFFARGRINRATSVEPTPGGKAAHVATAAQAMGARPLWLGFLGGSTGDEFAERWRKLGIDFVRVWTSKITRMNLELLEDSGQITEVLEPGEKPSQAELDEMLAVLRGGLERKWRNAVVVISGSLPRGVKPDFYRALIRVAKVRGSRVFLDTSGDALHVGLSARPGFVKPNLEETESLVGHRLKNQRAIVKATHELTERGAESAAVSLGPDGLVWVERRNGPVWLARPPRLKAISAVGSGDATVAGFAVAATKNMSGEAAIRLAVACGAANCLAKFPSRISRKDVKSLMPRIEVCRIG